MDGSTLELVAEYDGYQPIDMLASGEVAALMGADLVFLNLATGEVASQWTLVDPTIALGVSPDGNNLAYATGDRTFDLVSLVSDDVRNLNIQRSIAPIGITDFSFRPDSAVVFVTHQNQGRPASSQMFSVETGEQFYEIFVRRPITHAPDGDYYAYDGTNRQATPAHLARTSDDLTREIIEAEFAGRFNNWDQTTEIGSFFNSWAFSFRTESKTLGVLYTGQTTNWKEGSSTPPPGKTNSVGFGSHRSRRNLRCF